MKGITDKGPSSATDQNTAAHRSSVSPRACSATRTHTANPSSHISQRHTLPGRKFWDFLRDPEFHSPVSQLLPDTS